MKIINLENCDYIDSNKILRAIERAEFESTWVDRMSKLYVSDECANYIWSIKEYRHIFYNIENITFNITRVSFTTNKSFEDCLEYVKLNNNGIKNQGLRLWFKEGEEFKIYCNQTDEVFYKGIVK